MLQSLPAIAASAAPAPGERAFPALAAKLGDVGSVGIKRNALSLTFVRDGDNWVVAEKGNYPAAAGKVRQIALGLADAVLVESKTQKAEFYPRLDVEDPGSGKSTLVTLKDKSGATLAEMIIGKRRYDRLGTGTDGIYVRKLATPRHGSPGARSNSPISSPAGSTGAFSIFPRSGSPRRP